LEPQHLNTAVVHNSTDPGLKRTLGPESPDMSENREPDILDNIFRVFGAGDDTKSNTVSPVTMAQGELFERAPIATLRKCDETVVRQFAYHHPLGSAESRQHNPPQCKPMAEAVVRLTMNGGRPAPARQDRSKQPGSSPA
jgi:hypothetical protein